MKQFTIFLLCTCLLSMAIQAQTCLPDSTLKDSSAGVYPKPVTPTNPNGGIQKKACINKAYEFVFTVVVPDTVQIPILPTPLPLEKVAIDTSNAISNLPIGIGYSCNPPNCIFKKNEFGCLILHGVPTNDNSPGDFKPVIKLKLTVNVGVPFDYTTEYPGAAFPGEYILTLLSEKDCASSSIDTIQNHLDGIPIQIHSTNFELMANQKKYNYLINTKDLSIPLLRLIYYKPFL